MAARQETIVINILTKVKGLASLKRAGQGMRRVGAQVTSFGDVMRMPFDRWQRLNKIARMSTTEFRKFGKSADPTFLKEFGMKVNKTGNFIDNFSKKKIKDVAAQNKMTGAMNTTFGARMGNRIRGITHGLRGFRMELLGVMFFGMGVQKFFLGLVRPSMELVGVFKIFSVALQILFLPLALKVLDWALKFLGWVSKMSPKLKKWINIFVVAGIVIGSLLFLFGMFGLGIGSVILAFGALLAPIVATVGALFSFIGMIMGALPGMGKLAIALLIFLGIIPAVKGASGTIEEHGGIWKWLSGLIGRAVGWIIGTLDTLWESFLEIDFVKTALEGLGINVEKLKDPLATLGEALTGVWQGYLEKHPELIEKLGDMGLVADEILEPWNNLETVIPTILSTVVTTIKEKLKEIWDDFTENNPLIEDMGESMDSLKDSMEKLAALAPNLNTVLGVLAGILERAAGAAGILSDIFAGRKRVAVMKTFTAERREFGARQLGGIIPHSGAYRLHAGETVMPAGANTINFAPNITVNATSNVDIDMLKSQLSEELLTEVENMNRR